MLTHVAADLANVIAEVLRSVQAAVPGRQLHEMIAGVDSIAAAAKSAVFGDRDPDIVISADATFVEDVRRPLTPAKLAEANAALGDQAAQPTTSVTGAHGNSSAAAVATGGPDQVTTNNSCVNGPGADGLVLDAFDRVLSNPAILAIPQVLTAAGN